MNDDFIKDVIVGLALFIIMICIAVFWVIVSHAVLLEDKLTAQLLLNANIFVSFLDV